MEIDLHYIDGQTPLDEDEKADLKIGQISTRRELDEWEQLNIEEAVQWSIRLRFRSPEDFMTESFILDLHRRMFGKIWKWAGKFRRTNKNIGVDKLMIGLELRQLCDDFRYWHQNNIFTPEERVLRFKHRIVSIHCFPNGNGRHSRLIADILIDRLYGLPVFSWGGAVDNLSSASDSRSHYLAALREADLGFYGALIVFARS